MVGWSKRPLSDFVDPDRSICYGIVQPGSPVADGVPIVRVNNFTGGGVDTADALKVDAEIEAKYRRSRLQGGELLITLVGSMGLSAIAPDELRGWNVARAVGVVPLRPDADKRWINFVVRSQPSQDFIRLRANTTVQATFNLKDLAELPVPCPPDPVREEMSAILSALDDKIELNRRMNETLEAMARAIFRDWFVDFGPTRAKMAMRGEDPQKEGIAREPYLAPDLWSLFPDRIDDATGLPQGWETRTLGEISDHRKGSVKPSSTPEQIFEHYSLPAYDKGESPSADLGTSIKSNKTPVPADAVLLSKLNPDISRVWLPDAPSGVPQVSSTEFLIFTAKEGLSRGLLYSLFKDLSFKRTLEGMVTGTSKSHQRISPPALMAMPVITGDVPAFEAFARLTEPALERLIANRAESRTLAETRDYLLPKLMSGEIRVRDAEKLAGEAA